ncbi:MAG: serine/threonine protein kinase [Candidatus Sericytochromatia bacterium]
MLPTPPVEPLQGRYRLEQALNQAAAPTWRATDLQTQQEMIVKELHLQGLQDWKQLELFEREARTLSQLAHPGIPKLHAHFRSPDGSRQYMVLETVPGASLADKLQAGWRPSESQAISLAEQALDILVYLHHHQPPVVHRDIKPSNLMLSPEGRLYLIDFGAVQHVLNGERTVVGSFGYMAPEQFSGQARPQSDLYGLGATLVHLLSGRPPAELPQDGLRLRFSEMLQVSPALTNWLGRLLEPELERRTASAQVALTELTHLHLRHHPFWLTPRHRPGWGGGLLLLAMAAGLLGWQQYLSRHLSPPAYRSVLGNLPPQPAQSGPEAEAFRRDFLKRFQAPSGFASLPDLPITRLEELQALWRSQPQRSSSDPVFFKAAWQLLLKRPLENNTVVTAISLMASASEDYAQRDELLAFALERYFDHRSPEHWDRPAHAIAGMVDAYSSSLNRQGHFAQSLTWLERFFETRAGETNDHQLQRLSRQRAYALWKIGRKEEALKVLERALTDYPEGSWRAELQSLKRQITGP